MKDPEQMKLYMRRYRERQAAAEGRTLRRYGKFRKAKAPIVRPTVEAPGWPTAAELMAGR